jgi:broad specificity phosphatase PhoE
MKLYIIRHGETIHNKKGIIQGHYDAKLNRLGVKQAKLLAERLKVVNFDYIYSSDLSRTKRTTIEIAKYQNCPIVYTKKLRERNLSIFENKPRSIYYTFLKDYKMEGCIHARLPKGGESYHALQKRAVNFIEKIYHKHRGQTILISTHGGIKKSLLMYFNGVSLKNFHEYGSFKNTSLSIIDFHKDNKYKIELENDIKHLL